MSSARMRERRVLRFNPNSSAARIWLPRVAASAARQQRQLHLADDAVVEARRRQLLAESGEVAGEVALDLLAQILGVAVAEIGDLSGIASTSSCSMIWLVSVSCV